MTPRSSTEPAITDAGRSSFRDSLLSSGLLSDAGLPGLYHRSFVFERLRQAVADWLSAANVEPLDGRLQISPVIPQSLLERSGYVASFPDLVGTVYTFDQPTAAEHMRLLRHLESGADWTDALGPAGTALCSAACHPVYPLVSAVDIPASGRRYELLAGCFRREPSPDPMRMQTFHQHEFVYVGEPSGALEHRDTWLARGRDLLSSLGFDIEPAVASDPFFGRAGKVLSSDQLDKQLKYELTSVVAGSPVALASANYHEDHFGKAFGIDSPEGDPAHSACIGFGLERIVLALLWRHGLEPTAWPQDVRDRLSARAEGLWS